jgi:4-hydroxy-tetrahydrodipicolinate synthase
MSKTFALPPGIIASSMTPFDADGRPKLNAIRPHIDWLIDQGVAGISPIGTAGEFFAIEANDRKAVLEAVMKANNGRVPVVAGTHHYSTAITIDLSRHAQSVGADATLIVPSYYAAPTSLQMMDHYRRIADAVSIPTVLYHNTAMTGVELSTEQLVQLFEEKAIAGVKFSTVFPDRLVELLQATGGKLPIYAGYDFVAMEGLCHGVHGWISGLPSIVPAAAVKLYKAVIAQDLVAARKQWALLSPLMRFMFESRNNQHDGAHSIAVMKAALNMIGPDVGVPQLPIAKLDAPRQGKLASMLSALGYEIRQPVNA